jgi:ssDNA-binding Zn-finger/Zn-ribbon topoisomerase 1
MGHDDSRTVKVCDFDGNRWIKYEVYGNKLVEKNGRNGRFIGCTDFLNCRYTRSMRYFCS